jgi:Phasin protein
MAKRRAAHKRRQTRKGAGPQSTPRRRSEKKSNRVRHSAYSRRALEPGLAEPPRESVSASSDIIGRALPNYARTLATSKPPLKGQQAKLPYWTAMAQPPSVVRNGMLALMRELIHHLAQQVHHNLQAMNALVGCRSPQDFFRVQTDLAFGTLENIVQSASRSSLATIQMSTETARLMHTRPGDRGLHGLRR